MHLFIDNKTISSIILTAKSFLILYRMEITRMNKHIKCLRIIFALSLTLAFGCSGDMGGTPYTEYSYYIYMASNGNSSVVAYSFDAGTNTLTLIGEESTTNPATSVAVEPHGKYLYAAASGLGTYNNIFCYEIDQSTGNMAPLAPASYQAGLGTHALVIDPTGRYLYATNSNVAEYNVTKKKLNSETGALEIILNANATGTGPREMAVHPGGKYLYVANYGEASISGYSIDGSTGNLTAIDSFATPTSPNFIAISPRGDHLYVNYTSSNGISIYSIDEEGVLTEESLISPFASGIGEGLSGMAFNPTGKFLFIANVTTDDITVCKADAVSGKLAEIQSSPFPARSGPYALAIDPTGHFLFTANKGEGNLTVYAITREGELVKKAESVSGATPSPYALAVIRK
jgi:6-phosphogluconolactonase